MIVAIDNGYIYNNNKEVVMEFHKGNKIYTQDSIFYGTKDEAIDFGLIFFINFGENEQDD